MHRRSVLLSGITGASAFAVGRTTMAQNATPTPLATHPLTGVWLAMANPPLPGAPQVPAPSFFGADGTVLLMFPLTQQGAQGVQVNSPYMGTWEADSERRGHFTAVQLLSDADGTFLGSVTVDGYPEVSEDGQTFIDDNSRVTVTIRDATGALLNQGPGAGARPVTAIRMAPGAPGFPDGLSVATPLAGTPTPVEALPGEVDRVPAGPDIFRPGRPGRVRAGRGRRRRRRQTR